MGKIRWDNVILTLLLVSVIILSFKYYEVSKIVQPRFMIVTANCSGSHLNINNVGGNIKVVKFDNVGFRMTDLSQQSGNLLVNIFRISINNESVFVLSPPNSIYFTTALGDVSIVNQTPYYAVIFANESVSFSYDVNKFSLIPGFSGLWLIIDKNISEYYTYDVYLNNNSIIIINNKTGFKRIIDNIKMIKVKVDKINFIVYSSQYTPVVPVSLPTKPFSIIRIHVPKDSMFTGITSNGVNEIEFHFIKSTVNFIGYFVGMINTFGVVTQANNIFFVYSG